MKNINNCIDHTLLKPDATEYEIELLCSQAISLKFFSVCVAPSFVGVANSALEGSDVSICTVIGFPHGNVGLNTKLQQMELYDDYVDEFDVVINIGAIKSGSWLAVEQEIQYIRESTTKPIKYIVEVGYLTDEELFRVIDILIHYKIDFVKTCTGYGPRNIMIDDIVKIKRYVGDRIKIKASGGIKNYAFAKQLIESGADRIGSSSGVIIIKESKESEK